MKFASYESAEEIKVGDLVKYKFGTYTSKTLGKISSEPYLKGQNLVVNVEVANGTLPVVWKYVWKEVQE